MKFNFWNFHRLCAGVMLTVIALPPVWAGDVDDCETFIVAEKYQQAFPACKRAAEQGHAEAQYNLGVMYQNGEGVQEDKREAVKWYRKSAEQGFARAQYNLGSMYYNGEGVEEDKREAMKWYRKSAEQGHAVAQYNLGVMYYSGEDVQKDKQEAVKWFRKSAEQGDADAQYNFGVMYSKGESVIQDWQEVYIWFSLAAANGHKDGKKGQDIAAGFLTTSEIHAAKQEAKRRLQAIEERKTNADNDVNQSGNIAALVPIKPSKAIDPAQIAFENGWRSVVVIHSRP